jgi:tetratricopeptide (TPR) repeat protein
LSNIVVSATRGSRPLWLAVVAAAALGAGLADAQRASRAAPDVRVVKIGEPPAAVQEGSSFRVAETVANAGNAKAGASDVRYYLSRDRKASLAERRRSRANPRAALADVLLGGSRRVPALDAGKRSSAPRRAKAGVPAGTSPGEYYLLACADDRGAVRESQEQNNCLGSRKKVRIDPLPGSDVLRIDAAADLPLIYEPTNDADTLANQKSSCEAGPQPKQLTLGKSLSNLEDFLERTAGKDAMRAFSRSPDSRTAVNAQRAAGEAVIAGAPGAALAAMLRAHELEPKEASHLVGAAALATAVDRPVEALGMLDAAERLDDKRPGGMGFTNDTVALANRGHALLGAGRAAEAETALDAALASQPLLSEAAGSLSIAALCANDPGKALQARRRSRKREDPPVPPDESKGKESVLRHLPYPALPPQAAAMYPLYRGFEFDRLGEIREDQQRDRTYRQRMAARNPKPSALTLENEQRILVHVTRVAEQAPLPALQKAFHDQNQASHDTREDMFCYLDGCNSRIQQINETCYGRDDAEQCARDLCIPATKQYHQAWLNDATKAYAAGQTYIRAVSKRMSGVAANLKDPDAYALGLLAIERIKASSFQLLAQSAQYWSREVDKNESVCVEGSDPPGDTASGDTPAQGSGPCPEGLKAFNFVLELGPVELKANCAEVSVEGEIGEGWISGFGEVKWDVKAGTMSVVAGSKAKVGLGGVEAEFKSGVYVTVDQNGPKDAGWRVGPSSSVAAGPVEYSGPSDEIDISFVGIFSPPES